ncbi:MAG: hypothetical protein ACK463_12835, partial [Bradyrhizobium sp.]
AMVQFVGGTPQDALRYSREMAHVTIGRNPGFTLPMLDFIGAPVGIDVRKVVDESMRPVINTATAHKEPGMGIIGAGAVLMTGRMLSSTTLRTSMPTGAPMKSSIGKVKPGLR